MTTIATARDEIATQGFTVLRGVVPADLRARCRNVLEQWVEEMICRWQRQGLLHREPTEDRFRHRLLAAWEEAGRPAYERSPRADLVHLAPEQLFRILTHPALLDIASDLLGVDAIVSHPVWNSRPKAPAQRFTDTPWHQDAQYFPDQADRRMVNLWFPLHPVGEDDSCLAVAPRRHTEGLHESCEHETGFLAMRPAVMNGLEPVPVPLAAGDLIAFTNYTPHRALVNRSGAIRWSMDLRFAAAGDEDRWPLGRGIVARHGETAQQTTIEEWLAQW